jgi:quercetin dioxygenase-like cupin family protein
MLTLDLESEPLYPRGEGLDVAFPLHSGAGTASTAVVWMTLAPGGLLAEHTDSAEELLYVVDGEVEASIGDETGPLRAGELAVVPALTPHGARNAGSVPARLLGFFSSSTNVAIFSEPKGPNGERAFVIGAPAGIAPLQEADTLTV